MELLKGADCGAELRARIQLEYALALARNVDEEKVAESLEEQKELLTEAFSTRLKFFGFKHRLTIQTLDLLRKFGEAYPAHREETLKLVAGHESNYSYVVMKPP